jgi:hypothetical protein
MLKNHIDRYDLAAIAIILLGTLIRLILIALNWPAPYNDEATMGLMALHIVNQGAHPLLYYGQNYMGSLEAYLGAAFFFLLGPSTFALRLGLLILYALFLCCLYVLTSRLYPKSLAIFTLLVLAFGAPDFVFRQLMAAAGPPDYLFFTTLLLLLTAWLAYSANPSHKKNKEDVILQKDMKRERLPWQRVGAYAAWGTIAGLALWSHLLCLPFVLVTGVLLAVFCRKELRPVVLSLLFLFLLLGFSPFLLYQATVPVTPQENSLFTPGGYREPSYPALQGLPGTTATISPRASAPRPLQQVMGTLLVSIPLMTNGNTICPIAGDQAWPLTIQTATPILLCTAVHGVWSVGFVVLLIFATITTTRRFWTSWKLAHKKQESMEQENMYEAIRQGSRLMILSGTCLTLLAYILYAQASAVTPITSARYLVGLCIALPAILAPLWEQRHIYKAGQTGATFVKAGSAFGICLLILAVSLVGTITIFTTQVPSAHDSFQQQETLIQNLMRRGATDVYMEYDDCNRITFLSKERIICAALDKGLRPGLDRYYPYRTMVAASPQPYYVLLSGSTQATLFEQMAREQHIAFKAFTVSGYTIYDPARRIQV